MTALAMHERIRSEIEARILSGELAPGDRLPVEHELQAHYGCARMTVSKALSALSAAGLIERRKRAGSFVARPRMHAMILDIPDLQSEVRARGSVYAFELIARDVRLPRKIDPVETGLAAGAKLLALRGLHRADGRPLAFEDRVVSLAAVPAMADADLTQMSPGSWLLENIPWTEAETRISAIAVDSVGAGLLGLDAGAACLVVERRTWRGGDAITWVRQTFDATAYDLTARFAAGDR